MAFEYLMQSHIVSPEAGFCLLILIAGFFLFSSTVLADVEKLTWYRCVVKASSHTAVYTFRISTDPCKIYWQEIDTFINISECDPPVLSGLKPSARDEYSIVWFDLETGAFYDYLSGVKDRGRCSASEQEPAP
jgi:hypothetical protein